MYTLYAYKHYFLMTFPVSRVNWRLHINSTSQESIIKDKLFLKITKLYKLCLIKLYNAQTVQTTVHV